MKRPGAPVTAADGVFRRENLTLDRTVVAAAPITERAPRASGAPAATRFPSALVGILISN